MMSSGRLKHRLFIEAPVETEDGAGGVTTSYKDQATVWAEVKNLEPSRDQAADSRTSLLRLKISIRAGVFLSIHHRLKLHGRYHDIRTLRLSDGRSMIEIEAEARVVSLGRAEDAA